MHPRGIEVLVLAPIGVDAVEPPHHVVVHHVHHRFGHGAVDALEGVHAFLEDDLVHRLTFLDDGHLVALLAVEVLYLAGILHRHDAHAVGARVRFHHHVGSLGDAVGGIFFPDAGQQGVHAAGEALLPLAGLEIHFPTGVEEGVEEPGVHLQEVGEIRHHLVIAGEVVGFAAVRPARRQGRDDGLVQVPEQIRHPCGEIVIEKDGAGVVVLQHQPLAVAPDRFEQEAAPVGQRHGCGGCDLGQEGADAHFQPRLLEEVLQGGHVLQVIGVAGVVLRDDEEAPRHRTHLFHRCHGGLHAQREEIRIQVVEAAGKQVGVHGGQFEAAVAQIHRGIKRCLVLLPLAAEPVLDGGHPVQEVPFQFEQGAGEGGGEVGDHGRFRKRAEPAL